jgi:hypothetical protein
MPRPGHARVLEVWEGDQGPCGAGQADLKACAALAVVKYVPQSGVPSHRVRYIELNA